MSGELRERLGRRFARFATTTVVARPWLWRLFRGPLRSQFDALAGTWEERRGPEGLAPVEAALARVPTVRRALDLGTGTGKAARLVARLYPDAEVVGVDLSAGMVDRARALLAPELAERVRFEVGDASELAYADGAFDLVVLFNMIPFFPEIARVLAPGGSLVVAFVSGAGTPIYVSSETLRARLAPFGFDGFEDVSAGEGTALVARKSG